MFDSNLKQLLENLTKINELSKKAIDDINDFLLENDSSVSTRSNFVDNLSLTILSLSEERVCIKNSYNKLSTDDPKCSESPTVETSSKEEDPKESLQNPPETVTLECTEEATSNANEVSEKERIEETTDTSEKLENEPVVNEPCNPKPMLKIVDFNKLVDPRNLELMNKNQDKNSNAKNESIIVLSSSEDEAVVYNNKRNNLEKKIHKLLTVQAEPSVNQSTSSISHVEKVQGSINSNDTTCLNIEKDIKFRSKPYVKLLRVPCEEIEKFYARRHQNNSCEQMAEKEISEETPSQDLENGEENSNSCDNGETKKNSRKRDENDETESDNSNRTNAAKSRKVNESDEGEIEHTRRKSGPKSRTQRKTSKRKEPLVPANDSDSSDEEALKRKREDRKNNSKNKKISGGSSSEEVDSKKNPENSCVSVEDGTVPTEKLAEDSSVKDAPDGKSGDSSDNSGSDSETFTFSGKLSNTNKEDPTSNSNKTDKVLISSDNEEDANSEKGKEKEESTKQIILSSNDSDDDSDFDTFFKKNKFVKSSKKIKSSSESEGEKTKESETKCNGSDKESSKSENVSDKEEEDARNRKRKRIKKIEDDSSESDDAVTRRKLKKMISKDSLSAQTKKAAAEEKERKQRILEKQKKYNQIYESSELANSKVEKLVLDIDEKTGEPLLQVDKALVSKLKPHQASGIQFMWDACFESLARIKKSQGSGCILAHCMGLGKTLQVIALTNTLLEEEKTNVKKVLIVTPLSTVLNWRAEYKNWLSGDEDYDVYELASIRPQNADRASCVREWHEAGGVMIISYAMFRNLSNDKNKKVSKKFRTIFIEGLVDPGPDIVICDEGHLLKNEKTSLSVAMNRIRTRRRIVLTGTPLQNNLKEYYCMVQFVKPNLLGTYREYLNRFVNPITNGQYTDSTQYDINLMRRRSHVLHKLLDGIVQRRDYSVLAPYLPPKFEFVLFLTLTEAQKKLYKHYMEHFARQASDDGTSRASFLFKDFQALSRICIHPRVLLDKSNDDQQKYRSDDEESVGSLKDFIDDDGSTSTSSESSGSDSSSNVKKNKRTTKRITRAQKNNPDYKSDTEEEVVAEKEWWQQYCDGEELDNIAHGSKLLLLFEILKECEQIGDKVLVFSQSLYALNLIEYFLGKVDEATQNGDAEEKTCGYTGSWSPGLDYFRLDGSTNCGLRSEWCDSFNKESNSRARLFLLSTRAGGLGINLVAANRVILFDVSWNPSSDIQSIYRVYRFGQLKPTYVYRFVIYGTMEMKIYERQVTKQAISKRVIDEQQIDRHYNQNDLAELYKFEEPDLDVRPTPLVPKDVLLGELLRNHDDKIYKYHEHQTLLENKEDETLNEEERKAAWDEFENEKVDRTKQALIGKFSVSTVQLALRSIIQRDNPTWNNNQILSIIPQLIQQLNLQLSMGDQTMYNRIAAEVKVMQEVYARKMQMQFYQYRLQLAQNQQMQNMYQQQFQMMNMGSRFPAPGASGLGSNPENPNEVVELN
ncbi:transcriptional regulator ATRX homolog [Coccinella septempunctata]|uniref:transcriptional regulator ATRX homolog n=1 Tax=Coccinella septempunctata TaxID=41139 RepID=UPI001D097097|nr:transcriptional regulator ATRX homolog [Coccinella septempunctata]